MIKFKESFRFSNGVADYAVLARTVDCSPETSGRMILAFDVLSKPRTHEQNRIFEISNHSCKDALDVRHLTMRLLEDTYGFVS